jgi:predicted AAA+ superfamily ATPase
MANDLIIREKYWNKVIPFIGKQLIKVFTGQRRVGKSFILKQTVSYIEQHNADANIIFIDKENLKFSAIKNAEDLNCYVTEHFVEGKSNCVFIDEIQDIEHFEVALRSLNNDASYDIYCTGSNAFMLSGELGTYLSGRYIEIEVKALSFSEFLQFHDLQSGSDALKLYMRYGGLPYLKHLELKNETVFDYLKGVYNTILYRDIVKRHYLRNTAFLENLMRFLADNIGHLSSAKSISDYLKSQMSRVAVSQVIDYLGYITETFMLHRVGRVDVAAKKIFEIGEKYYFEDVGLRNAFWEYRPDDVAKILENLVYNHLKYNDYDVKVGQLMNSEIDFVCRKNGEYLYIQVTYLLGSQETVEREFGNLEKIRDNYPKMVVSMDEFAGKSRNGVQHIHLLDFLNSKKW